MEKKNIKEMNSTEVKAIAKELKIKDWWNKKKDILIAEIEAIQKAQEEAKKPEPKKEPTPADENIITLKEIVAELGIKGMKARRILRNADIQRPYKRWEWHKEEHKDIIQKVKDLLKK
jgi:hypothetical protein